jgi:hypothetical protein
VGFPKPPPFSPLVLLTLVAVVAASSVTFWVLVRRSTSHRRWVALAEWARETGFRFNRVETGEAPEPFRSLQGANPVVCMQLSRPPTTLVQLEAGELTAPAPAVPPGVATATVAARSPATWNLLVRKIESSWRPTGLRPTNAAASVLDLFSLSSFPLMGSERFTAYGTDSAAARVLSKSMMRSLLPPDIGLLLHGPHLVLDFSARHFDAIELNRIRALADQLSTHLPRSS